MPRANAKLLLEAIERAGKAGIVFVTAASNEGNNNDVTEVYPANANLSNTITVAATDAKDAKPKWSNYGKAKVAIAAPGDSIMSTIPGNRYGSISGTSMSAPLVAGLVALVKRRDSKLTPIQIRSLLQASGDKASVEVACQCRINAAKTMQNLVAQKMFVSPYAQTLKKGESLQMEAVFGQAPFTFQISNPNVASVDDNGKLTGLSKGSVELTVTDANGVSAKSGVITTVE
jgi:thermitase